MFTNSGLNSKEAKESLVLLGICYGDKAGSHVPVAMGLVSIAQAEAFSVVISCVLGILKTLGRHRVSSMIGISGLATFH